MKVLHVINSLAAGGAEKLVQDLAVVQSKSARVGVFTFNNQNDIFNQFDATGVILHKCPSNNYYSIKNLFFLMRTIKRYDIVHVHLFPSLYIASLCALFLSKDRKFIYTEHNSHNRRRDFYFFKFIEKFIYNQYEAVVCITEGVKLKLEDWIGKKPMKVCINNFINLQGIEMTISAKRTSFGFEKEDVLLVMVGSFRKQKDQSTLVRSLALLPDQYKLILIGDGPLKSNVQQEVASLNLKSRVHFLGIRTDVFEILKFCDYGVQSSFWEGFGIAAIEYMACALPTFGTNVTGLNEVILNEHMTFEPTDSKELASKILHLESNIDLKNEIVTAQTEKIKRFDIEYALKSHFALYNQIINKI